MNPIPRVIIFTDLDGSLLDDDYSWRGAEQVIAEIRRTGIPLVLTTSKTRREVERIQGELSIRDPFIVENGGAVFFPSGYSPVPLEGGEECPPYTLIRFGKTYREVKNLIEQVRPLVPLKGFADLSVEEVSQATGLSTEAAALAKAREFTEPFVLEDPAQLPLLETLALKKGLKITAGGRFHHLMGAEQDKGKAVEETIRLFSSIRGETPLSIGLGDSDNDLPMLRAVKIPVLIPRTDGLFETDIAGLRRAPFPGSRGWGEAVRTILEEIGAWPMERGK